MDRRRFLESSALAAASLAVPNMVAPHILGANGYTSPGNKINLGFIGVGGMGSGHLSSFLGFEDVRVRAVCDVREQRRSQAKTLVEEQYKGDACATYHDFRELLAREDIDAVLIAVPDHWHVLIGLEAARRGKAMYYEKPMGYTINEAQAIRASVNRYGVTFQFGTQQRSDQRFRHAVELVRNERIGELKRIVIGSASYDAVPAQSEEPIPDGLDYNFWLGPAPEAPYTPLRCTRQWTLIRDYSLGCLGGAWGTHHVDIAQWAMDADDSGPIAVEGRGSLPEVGLFDTFQRFEVEHTYASGAKLLHLDHMTARSRFPQFNAQDSKGILFEGTQGWIYVARGFIDASPKSLLRTKLRPNDIRLPVSSNHRRNFIDAVRTGTDPICPVGPGVKTEIACQQADIAIRVGSKLRWDNDKERFLDSEAANRMLSSPMRGPWHL